MTMAMKTGFEMAEVFFDYYEFVLALIKSPVKEALNIVKRLIWISKVIERGLPYCL